MISDKKIQTKQKGVTNIINDEATRLFSSKATSSNNSSRQWSSAFRNPRIVRVSRAFGGKDRHSKVCTIRGLRDRRIRLSVPTAIQLYDLQDRLGLTQPSKVIDWLIDNTKDDIDNLPPLQIPQLGFGKFESNNPLVPSALMFDPNFRKSLVSNKEENRFKGFENDEHPSSMFNNGFPYNFDPSNLSLSSSSSTQYGGNHDNNSTPNSIGSQFLFCPPPPSNMPNSIFPTYAHQYFDSSSSSRLTQNTINNFNFLSSGNNNSSIKLPFSLNANPGFDHPQNQDQTHPDDDKH